MSEPSYAGYPANCPLTGATPAGGAAFRVTKADPPTDADFLSPFEMGATPKFPKPSKTWLCKQRSLSIYRDIGDARQHLDLYPMAEQYIAGGHLTPAHGHTLPTPPPDGSRPSHEEWWCADGCDRRTGFLVVDGANHVDNHGA